jgi:hypothetical protein
MTTATLPSKDRQEPHPNSRPVERGTRDQAVLDRMDELGLSRIQRAYLQERWLGQVTYLGRAAQSAQRRYFTLRLVAILGGVTIPALVGLNVGQDGERPVQWLTFALGLLVAAAVALEEFFRYGDRWRHYRLQAELLRGEGWAFLQLAGPSYRRFSTHADAFRLFVARAEETIRQEVGVYIAEVARAGDEQHGERRDEVPEHGDGREKRPDAPVHAE